MSKIPGDVWEAALGVVSAQWDLGYSRNQETLTDLIARAIMAERSRCAKVAETLGVYPELNVFSGGPEWYLHGQEIASAIRRGN